MSKHTPGPWKVDEQIITDNEMNEICSISPFQDEFKEEEQANARLIAAAPELLVALKLMTLYLRYNSTNQGDELVSLADKAIAKAEGL